MRLTGEIDADLFGRKGMKLRDRIATLDSQLQAADTDRSKQVILAAKVFELSQGLERVILDVARGAFYRSGAHLHTFENGESHLLPYFGCWRSHTRTAGNYLDTRSRKSILFIRMHNHAIV